MSCDLYNLAHWLGSHSCQSLYYMRPMGCLFVHLCALLSASGSWSSMVGSGESIQKLGLIPCAISWLYSAIERRREKTWTDLTVSVSAIELCCGEEDTLRDLLGEVVPSAGSIQDSPKAHIRLQEDPVYGIQVKEKVFFLLFSFLFVTVCKRP